MRILMVTAELAPLAKVGGLGDMVASLSAALAGRGHDVRVVLPLYGDLDKQHHKIRVLAKYPPFQVRVGQAMHCGRLHLKGSAAAAVKVYAVECKALYSRPGIYTGPDGKPFRDALAREVFHAQVALQLPGMLGWSPQIVHAHDAQAALAVVYLKRWYGAVPGLSTARSLLTIHNLAHQEIHAASALGMIGLPEQLALYPGILEYHGDLNLLKAGILEADLVNTVSPTYAREVVADTELGCGLAGVLKERGEDFSGILNGADLSTWDPARDPLLPARYSPADLSGKALCRSDLASSLGLLEGRGPLVGMVGRLAAQKGLDLVLPVLDELVKLGFCLVVLGTGEGKIRDDLALAAARHRRQLAFIDSFDETLAHRIIAASDIFLMPSRFEPCGLTQMYAMRYGSVPVVRHTGGLADTVIDASRAGGTGFVFRPYQPQALLVALRRAQAAFTQPLRWSALVQAGMARDFGWDASAAAYEALYASLVAEAPAQSSERRTETYEC